MKSGGTIAMAIVRTVPDRPVTVGVGLVRGLLGGRRRYAGIAVFTVALLLQFALQRAAQPYAIDGYRFQEWSSETMMQTVSIADLRDAPLESLFNLHIQPPGLDSLRALLVHVWPTLEIQSALRRVDLSLYVLWAIAYACGGVLVFLWLDQLTQARTFALIASLLLVLHPAMIFFATLLDTTIVTAVLVLWMYYSLWCIGQGRGSIAAVTAAVVLLFLFRSAFQWPVVVVLGLSLSLLRVPWRRVAWFVAIAGSVYGLYTFKQYTQFGVLSSSSLMGINLVRSADMDFPPSPRGGLYGIDLDPAPPRPLPSVLTRQRKIDGSVNFNNFHYLEFNARLTNDYARYVRTFPIRDLLESYSENLGYYLDPSSQYTKHVIVDRLPWRGWYDRIFSGPLLVVLMGIAAGIAVTRGSGRASFPYMLGLALPALYVVFITVMFEKGENARFKFFLEPVYFVFIASQLHYAWRRVRGVVPSAV